MINSTPRHRCTRRSGRPPEGVHVEGNRLGGRRVAAVDLEARVQGAPGDGVAGEVAKDLHPRGLPPDSWWNLPARRSWSSATPHRACQEPVGEPFSAEPRSVSPVPDTLPRSARNAVKPPPESVVHGPAAIRCPQRAAGGVGEGGADPPDQDWTVSLFQSLRVSAAEGARARGRHRASSFHDFVEPPPRRACGGRCSTAAAHR